MKRGRMQPGKAGTTGSCLTDGAKDAAPNLRGRGALPRSQQHEPMPKRSRHAGRGFKD